MPPWQAKWWMVPSWQGCRLLTSSVVAAVMPGTDTASVTGNRAQAHFRLVSGGLGFVGVGGVWGFQLLMQPNSAAQGEGLISGIQKHMAQILASPSGRNVDKIAEMDLRWEEDRLFNTGWHFQEGRDEVKATVSRRWAWRQRGWV